MKLIKSKVPENSLVAGYLPAGYSEAYEVVVPKNDRLTPDNLLISSWTDFPVWLQWLFRLRDVLVKPFGLEGADDDYCTFQQKFTEIVRNGSIYKNMSFPAKNGNETVMQMSDKHLTAELSYRIENLAGKQMKITVITLVHYHKALGKIYFAVIKLFHIFIVKAITKRSIGKLTKSKD